MTGPCMCARKTIYQWIYADKRRRERWARGYHTPAEAFVDEPLHLQA